MGPKTVGSRDIIMDNARNIAHVRNERRIYYSNEDLPDAIKCRKSDFDKYVNYLKWQGHKAQKVGDDVIVNGRRYKYEELHELPIGRRLLDSRTIFNRRVVALSRLFRPSQISSHVN